MLVASGTICVEVGRGGASEALLLTEIFSILERLEGTRRLWVEGRDRNERAANDFEPRRTCSASRSASARC